MNPSALKEHIQEFRLTKYINKATLIPAVNSFVESYSRYIAEQAFIETYKMYVKEILNIFYAYLHKTNRSNRLL